MKNTKKLTTCALMVALATVLALVSKLIPAPWLQGGSVTLASAVPIILASVIMGPKWGILTALTFSVIQMMSGFYPPPTQTFLYFLLVVFLDYVLAFGVYGIAGVFCRKEKPLTIPLAGLIVTLLRFVCHFISGLLIWGVYASEGQSVIAYSLIYNGSYMLPEIVITTLVLAALAPSIRKFL